MVEVDINIIESFLNTARNCIKKRKMTLVNRNNIDIGGKIVNTKQALVDLEMSMDDVWTIVSKLTSNEFIGISFDHDTKRDNNSEIFEFIKEIRNTKIYIKLTIDEIRGLVCLSFHRSNRGKE